MHTQFSGPWYVVNEQTGEDVQSEISEAAAKKAVVDLEAHEQRCKERLAAGEVGAKPRVFHTYKVEFRKS